MADFTFTKSIFPVRKHTRFIALSGKTQESIPGSIAWAVFVLLCFWAGSQLLSLVIHTPDMFSRLSPGSDHPPIIQSTSVSTVFGLMTFLLGSLVTGLVLFFLYRRERRNAAVDQRDIH